MSRGSSQRNLRHRIAGFCAAGLAVTLLAACGSTGSDSGGTANGDSDTDASASVDPGSDQSDGDSDDGGDSDDAEDSDGNSDSGEESDGTDSAVQRGGTLTVGIVGGSAKDTLDAFRPVTHPDEARVIQLYDTLLDFDHDFLPVPGLAESFEPNDAGDVWTATLREGLKFSDGSPITADDVIASYTMMSDPDDPTNPTSSLSDLDRDGFVKVDDRTVEFHLNTPIVDFDETVAGYAYGIVPADYDPENPIGSGPFMLDSFTPGKQSVMVANPNYWREGQPYLDELVLINFPDDSARVNALLSGQVDVIDDLPLSQVGVIDANSELEVLESETGGFVPFTMRIDQAPFDDVRVRQAFRLIVDRQQMVDQVLAGHGTIGNDIYGRYDQCYPESIPQRTQDIEGAKELLADAGQEDLTVDLVTASAAAGMVEAAQVFAEQAKAAGVTVNVDKVDQGVFYGEDYLSWNFSQDFFFTHGYLNQSTQSTQPDSPYNETHWADDEWVELIEQIKGTVDGDARCDLIREAAEIEYERGGYIIWGFPNQLDAYHSSVQGLVPDNSGIPLSQFGFRDVWLEN